MQYSVGFEFGVVFGFGCCDMVLRVLGFVLITVGCGFGCVYTWRGVWLMGFGFLVAVCDDLVGCCVSRVLLVWFGCLCEFLLGVCCRERSWLVLLVVLGWFPVGLRCGWVGL